VDGSGDVDDSGAVAAAAAAAAAVVKPVSAEKETARDSTVESYKGTTYNHLL
jgi:hypothetical protein